MPGRQITNRFGHTPPAAALVTRHTDDKISGAGNSLAQLRSPRCCSKDKTDASATRSALLQGRRRKASGRPRPKRSKAAAPAWAWAWAWAIAHVPAYPFRTRLQQPTDVAKNHSRIVRWDEISRTLIAVPTLS